MRMGGLEGGLGETEQHFTIDRVHSIEGRDTLQTKLYFKTRSTFDF